MCCVARGTVTVRRRQCPKDRSQLSPAMGRALALRRKRGQCRGCREDPDRRTVSPGVPNDPRLVKPRDVSGQAGRCPPQDAKEFTVRVVTAGGFHVDFGLC